MREVKGGFPEDEMCQVGTERSVGKEEIESPHIQRPSGRREDGGTRIFKARCLWVCRTVRRMSMGLTILGPEVQGSAASLGDYLLSPGVQESRTNPLRFCWV